MFIIQFLRFLANLLFWNRLKFRQFLAICLYIIGIRPHIAYMVCSAGDEILGCGYFEIEAKYTYFAVALPLPWSFIKHYQDRIKNIP